MRIVNRRQDSAKGGYPRADFSLTCNLEKLCTHFDDLDACGDFLGLLLDYARTFCDGIGNGRSTIWTQAHESAKLHRVDRAVVIMIEGLEQILYVLGQAVLGRH